MIRGVKSEFCSSLLQMKSTETYNRDDVNPTAVAVGMAAGAMSSHLSSDLRICCNQTDK